MRNAVEIKNVSKHFPVSRVPWYKNKVTLALSHINLEVKEGECFAFLGPNGAGKTTLIKTLCSIILPDEGEINIAGYNLQSQEEIAKSKIGLVTGEERSFYWRLTGRQNLEFFACFYDVPSLTAQNRIDRLAEHLGIYAQLDKRFQEYSTGTKQKVAIIRGLLNDPAILLIDEPTKSLDPAAAQDLRRFVKELVAKQRKTILFTTHQINEAEILSDRVAIIDKGLIKAAGTISELGKAISCPNASLYEIFTQLTRGDSKE